MSIMGTKFPPVVATSPEISTKTIAAGKSSTEDLPWRDVVRFFTRSWANTEELRRWIPGGAPIIPYQTARGTRAIYAT